MSLVVETGLGLSAANAYDTVANVVAYHAARGVTVENTKAAVTLSLSTNPTDGDTFIVGVKEYTLLNTLTNVDGNIKIGASLAETQTNIIAAVNFGLGRGSRYAALTTANVNAVASTSWVSNTLTFTAIEGGIGGNLLEGAEGFTAPDNGFLTANFTGGENSIEHAIIEATSYLDRVYSWVGIKKTATQSLLWPRQYAYDKEGYAISEDVIPVQIKSATAELALRALSGELTPDVSAGSNIERERTQIGSIVVDTSYLGGQSVSRMFPDVQSILYGLTIGTFNMGGAVRG